MKIFTGRIKNASIYEIRKNRMNIISEPVSSSDVSADVVNSQIGADLLQEEIAAVEGTLFIDADEILRRKSNLDRFRFSLVLLSSDAGLLSCPFHDFITVIRTEHFLEIS